TKAKEVMNTMLTNIVTIVKETPEKIWNCIVGAVTKVAEWGTNMQTKAKEVMNTMLTNIVTIVKETPEKIWNCIVGAVTKVATWGTEVKNKAVEGMKSVISGITDAFKNIGSTFAGFGKNMVEGIWNGISNTTQWIKDKIKGWVGDVTSFLKNLFGIASPSKLMRDEIGVYLAQGIGVGFAEEMDGVNKQIEDAIPKEFDVGAKVNMNKEPIDFTYDIGDGKPKPKTKGGAAAGGLTVIQNIYANTTDYVKQQKEAARQFKMIARTV
ncbi:MAG: PblA, partial [Lachnospiraceae bacterium]|nr:PblA [Lachnospiraceae bacterium]